MARANEFQKEVGELLKNKFSIAHRLPDEAFNRSGGRQVSQKPFDYFGSTKRGIFWGAEAKRVRSIRFPMRNFTREQRKAADNTIKNANYWLFINWRLQKGGWAIWIPYEEYKEVETQILTQQNRKSLRPEDFNTKWFLQRITGGWTIPTSHPYWKL